jgi:hypothetical protein
MIPSANTDKSHRLHSSHFQYSLSSSSISARVDTLLTFNMSWTMRLSGEPKFWIFGHTSSTRPVY